MNHQDFDYSAAANTINLVTIPDVALSERSLSQCHICLKKTKLSREHIPPKSAFNNDNRLWDHLYFKDNRIRPFLARGGLWVETLCERCNKGVCAIYANEYVKFIKSIVEGPSLWANFTGAKFVGCRFNMLYVAKELAAMILAIEPIDHAIHHVDLRRFVLNKEETIYPPFTIYAFLVENVSEAGTISRYHARVDTFAPGFGFSGGEISFYPFGFIYFNRIGERYALDKFTDITHWFHEKDVGPSSFYSRITGVESMNCLVNGIRRVRPQIDYLYRK